MVNCLLSSGCNGLLTVLLLGELVGVNIELLLGRLSRDIIDLLEFNPPNCQCGSKEVQFNEICSTLRHVADD